MWNILILLLVILQLTQSFVPHASLQKKTKTTLHLSSPYLYRQEPTPLEREVISKEEGDPTHSTFHVEKGPTFVENKADPKHSVHHHLIDVDHEKLHDLNLRAQKAWLPVETHEMSVDAVTVSAALFAILALILFTVPQ